MHGFIAQQEESGACVGWWGTHPYSTTFPLNPLSPDFATVLDSAWKRKWRLTSWSAAPPSQYASRLCYSPALYAASLGEARSRDELES